MVAVAVLVGAVIVAIVLGSSYERIAVAWMLHSVPRDPGVADVLGAAVDDGVDVWLIVGNDDRSAVPRGAQISYGRLAGQRADLIMLVAVDSVRDEIRILSIPRDLTVPTAEFGPLLLGETFGYGGSRLLVQSVTAVTGQTPEHYLEWSFDGFVRAVDSVGGVEVEFCEPIRDGVVGLDFPAGPAHLDGEHALALARTRIPERLFGEEWEPGRQGDRERMRRQLDLVDLLVDRVDWSHGLGDLLAIGRATAQAVVLDPDADTQSLHTVRRLAGTGVRETRRLGAVPIRSQADRRSPFGAEHLGGRLYLQLAVDAHEDLDWFAGEDEQAATAHLSESTHSERQTTSAVGAPSRDRLGCW